jgi:hypothetical protein
MLRGMSAAITYDAKELPILVVEMHRPYTDAEQDEYFATIERHIATHPTGVITVIVAHPEGLATREQQKRQAEWIKRNRDKLRPGGTAFVLTKPAFRFVLSTILLISGMPHDYVVVSTLDEGMKWARARLAERVASSARPEVRR